jgi:hypothetical protein
MLTINEAMQKHSGQPQSIQIQLGYQLYESYKHDEEFNLMLQIDRRLMTIYHYAWEMIENVQNVIKPALSAPDLDAKKRKELVASLAKQEETIYACIKAFPEEQQKIIDSCKKFGYPIFQKKIHYTSN